MDLAERLTATPEYIPVDAIDCNDYNANQMTPQQYKQLVAEIREHGMLSAILVYRDGERFIVVDGEHRFLAAKEAGLEEIPAFVLSRKPTRAEAITLTLQMNALQGEWDKAKLQDNLLELKALDEEALKMLASVDAEVQKQLRALERVQTDAAKRAAEEAEREQRLRAKVEQLIKQALIEGNGSIAKGYLKILDRDTGKEMFFLFEKQSEIVRAAIEHVLRTTGEMSNADGNALELICADYLAGVGWYGPEGDEGGEGTA